MLAYILVILFFLSLISIIAMIWRKLHLLQNGQILINPEIPLEMPHLKSIKYFTVENIKKYEHALLETIVRSYIKSANFLKNKYEEIKLRIKDRINKNHINKDRKEISKFLKIVMDYKHKIREIKHKIKKEENL